MQNEARESPLSQPGQTEPWHIVNPERDQSSAKRSGGRSFEKQSDLIDFQYPPPPPPRETGEDMSGAAAGNSAADAELQETYDAIEDGIYKDMDKDTSTGKGYRVHTGNYRMKEKNPKVTAKHVNSSTQSGGDKQ